MTDRELLELAAKAAGIVWDTGHCGWYQTGEGFVREDWNPLTDDGDALRLAVKLRIHIEPGRTMGGSFVEVHAWPSGRGECGVVEPLGADDNAATRRAIVRSAAEIGKAM